MAMWDSVAQAPPASYTAVGVRSRATSSLGALRTLIIIGLLAFSAPLWLPQTLGGQALYQYVVSSSMTGSVDRGSLVIIWPQESYAVGDVVAFKMEFSPGMVVPILHRVIGRDASGDYLIKGDAATGTDRVRPDDVMGKMTLGIPFFGFVGGASKYFPLSIAFVILAPMLVGRAAKDDKKARAKTKHSSLFFPVAVVVLASIPLASVGIAGALGRPIAAILLLGSLATARFAEITYRKELGGMTDVLYMMIGVAAFSMVYIPDVLTAFKALWGL